MACSDVDGNFEDGLLFTDGDDNVFEDAIMRITQPPNANGDFKGRFDGDDAEFTGKCEFKNKRTEITVTRKRNNGTTTTYTGRVKRVETATVRKTVIRGRFDGPATITADEEGTLAPAGDWETEKPT